MKQNSAKFNQNKDSTLLELNNSFDTVQKTVIKKGNVGCLCYDVIIYCVKRFENLKLHKDNKNIEVCLVLFERHNEKDRTKGRIIE